MARKVTDDLTAGGRSRGGDAVTQLCTQMPRPGEIPRSNDGFMHLHGLAG